MGERTDPEAERETSMDLRHLRREARSALELAAAAMAPFAIIDGLALSAGLLEALVELPADSAPMRALVPRTVNRTRRALDDWQKWRFENLDDDAPHR
jgi:hypothetical protein